MHDDKRVHIIGEKIAGILSKGLTLSDDAVHFIDSTFFSPSAEEIQAIIGDPDNCEREVLLQMIFFPDEKMQLMLEPFIEKHPLGKEDETRLLNKVKSLCKEITIYLPDDRGCFSMVSGGISRDHSFLFDFSLAHLIFHLNCSKILPQKLIDAIDEHVDNAHKLTSKVRLRNAGFDFTEKKIIWLGALFKAAYKFSDIHDGVLNFALEFVDNLDEQADIYEQLMALKRLYFRAIEKNNAFEAQMQKSNMETLVMQGKRGAGIDSRTARQKIAFIDRISYGIYKKTLHIEPFVSENELGSIQTDADMQNVIKLLGT